MPVQFAIKESSVTIKYKFSVCTLVTHFDEYQEMVTSFIKAGFTEDICEYRYIDNSAQNTFDAYKGINLFLQNAAGEFIIICHQDVLLNFDDIKALEQRMKDITALDNTWGVLGNAGGIENNLYKRFVTNIIYPDGFHDRVGSFPQKVISVDENFIIVKKQANLALSDNLTGFHLYGTDLCLIAELLGYSAYVIDFKLTHKSRGSLNESYYATINALVKKYSHFMRNRRVVTTIVDFYLSASAIRTRLFESKFGKKVSRKISKMKRDKR